MNYNDYDTIHEDLIKDIRQYLFGDGKAKDIRAKWNLRNDDFNNIINSVFHRDKFSKGVDNFLSDDFGSYEVKELSLRRRSDANRAQKILTWTNEEIAKEIGETLKKEARQRALVSAPLLTPERFFNLKMCRR